MNENEDESGTTVEQTDLDDSRFQVKWQKKAQHQASPPTPSAVEDQPSDTTVAQSDVAELTRQLGEERARSRELQDKWQRSAAELSNLRKRHQGEREDMEKMSSMALVYDILPVVDNFDRALNSIPGNLQRLTWIQGIMLIARQMQAILESRGVTPIEATGAQFDPHVHEAIGERESEEAAPNTVVFEYQRGYIMHGHILRPSLVEVARAPAAPSSAPEQPDSGTMSQTDTADGNDIAEEAQEENVGP
jgi:molecular chaperone GrpE